MASDAQINANRRNALKSTGPRSKTGREISSRNSTRHGLLARTVVIRGESQARFDFLLDSLRADLNPQNALQLALVETMAVARWRQQRHWAVEQAAINIEIDRREMAPDTSTPAGNAASAMRGNVDAANFLDRLQRQELRLGREYDRAFDRLKQLKKADRHETNPI